MHRPYLDEVKPPRIPQHVQSLKAVGAPPTSNFHPGRPEIAGACRGLLLPPSPPVVLRPGFLPPGSRIGPPPASRKKLELRPASSHGHLRCRVCLVQQYAKPPLASSVSSQSSLHENSTGLRKACKAGGTSQPEPPFFHEAFCFRGEPCSPPHLTRSCRPRESSALRGYVRFLHVARACARLR
ncbi:hypothetical protein MN608_00835 [Microdochium nivale]|nr:hypothetical protein MN608_00835 [Microdochium nivale]